MDQLWHVLRDLGLYVVLVLAFLAPIEAFLRYRRWATRHGGGGGRAYLPLADPWVPLVVGLSGAAVIALLVLLT